MKWAHPLALMLVATLLSISPAPGTAEIMEPLKGVSAGSHYAQATSDLAWETNEIAAATPGQLIRIDHWGAPANDTAIQAALNAGLKPLIIVGGTMQGNQDPVAYAQFAATLANRWPQVNYWELGGNEPNINGISAANEMALIHAAAPAIRARIPWAVITNGGIAPATAPNDPVTYTRGLVTNGLVAGDLDHFQLHLYEDANVRAPWNIWDQTFHEETMGKGNTVRAVLDDAGMPALRISSGESGYGAALDDATQLQYVHNAFADFAARRAQGEKVGFILIYCMNTNESVNYALTRTDRSRRPAWYELAGA